MNLTKFSNIEIINVTCRDIRFPTADIQKGTDAMHTNCNYSCAYLEILAIDTNNKLIELPIGLSMIFTIGKGTEVCILAVEGLKSIILNKTMNYLINNFANIWRQLTSEPQMRWLGPEKGVIHLATAGIVNAIWDLWAKLENKPIWKLMVDLSPEEIVSLLDFRYVTDVLTKEEALDILKNACKTKKNRTSELLKDGFPAYTTGAGDS